MPGPIALTGTPGTGKSAVAARLAARWRVREVGDLALELASGRRRGPRSIEVDLERLGRRLRSGAALADVDIVVGHLAHLLPIRDVVVLRCHPVELERRLRQARRGTAAERRENFVVEATDAVLREALARRRRVWEVDSSGRPVAEVARAVARRVAHRGAPSYGRVDWLRDPAVTAHLLDRPR